MNERYEEFLKKQKVCFFCKKESFVEDITYVQMVVYSQEILLCWSCYEKYRDEQNKKLRNSVQLNRKKIIEGGDNVKIEKKWIKASDISSGGDIFTIKNVGMQSFKDGDRVYLEFEEVSGKLILNQTTINALVSAISDETDDWTGKKVKLKSVYVQFNGKEVQSVKFVELVKTKAK